MRPEDFVWTLLSNLSMKNPGIFQMGKAIFIKK